MKTHLPFPFPTALGLLLGMAFAVPAAQVTFQVNMSAQAALGNFDPALDSVVVAGDPINGWSTAESPLLPSPGNPAIWTGTFDVGGTAGATAQYKFVMITAAGTTWEGNVGTGGGTGNRTFTLSDSDQTLPVVFFNNVTSGSSVSADVTFRVDMSVQTELGAFDPASGTVSVAGEFNNWNTTAFELAPDAATPGLWKGTLRITGAANGALSYKFVMNGGTWEGDVGAGGAQNRAFTLTAQPQVLPVAFFNNVTSVPKQVPVTFQVNVAVLTARGRFDPAFDIVSVAGAPLNDWNTSAAVLTPGTANPHLWTGTFDVTGAAGTVVQFKYVVNGGTWESIDNRTYTLPGTDPQTLAPVYFDNVSDLGPITVGDTAGGQLKLSWTAGTLVRLQTAPEVSGAAWQDVPNTEGQEAATIPIGTGRAFYRLKGP